MALDTAVKRISSLGWGETLVLPFSDGTIDQGDRQAMLGYYSGIIWESSGIASGLVQITGYSSKLKITYGMVSKPTIAGG